MVEKLKQCDLFSGVNKKKLYFDSSVLYFLSTYQKETQQKFIKKRKKDSCFAI